MNIIIFVCVVDIIFCLATYISKSAVAHRTLKKLLFVCNIEIDRAQHT